MDLHAGYQDWAFSLRGGGAGPSVSLWAAGPGGRGRATWDRLPVDPASSLSTLCEAWEAIAGPFMSPPRGPASATVDLSSALGLGAGGGSAGRSILGPDIIRLGPTLEVRHGDFTFSPGNDGVIVVETLLSLGGMLADLAGGPVSERWRELAAQTDLPPFPVQGPDMEPAGDPDAEDAWYAARLGQDVGAYRRAGAWLQARQASFAAGRGSEPGPADRDVTRLPEGLPGDEGVEEALLAAAAATGVDVEELRSSGVGMRNFDARQVTVFRRFYG